jgi:hypothetical protein
MLNPKGILDLEAQGKVLWKGVSCGDLGGAGIGADTCKCCAAAGDVTGTRTGNFCSAVLTRSDQCFFMESSILSDAIRL